MKIRVGINVWPMATLLRGLYLRDCGSDLHTVFTGVLHRPIQAILDHSQIWLIWGVTLAGSACRVKGLKIGR